MRGIDIVIFVWMGLMTIYAFVQSRFNQEMVSLVEKVSNNLIKIAGQLGFKIEMEDEDEHTDNR